MGGRRVAIAVAAVVALAGAVVGDIFTLVGGAHDETTVKRNVQIFENFENFEHSRAANGAPCPPPIHPGAGQSSGRAARGAISTTVPCTPEPTTTTTSPWS